MLDVEQSHSSFLLKHVQGPSWQAERVLGSEITSPNQSRRQTALSHTAWAAILQGDVTLHTLQQQLVYRQFNGSLYII